MAMRTIRSGPKRRRAATEQPTPMMAGRWVDALTHCSTKITMNMAVMAKSMPVVSKVRRFPARLPTTQPMSQ